MKLFRNKNTTLLVLSIIFIAGDPQPLVAAELLISAAMSLKNAFEDLSLLYEQQTSVITVRCNFGSSGALEKQIESGAPADVFASASPRFMDMLEQKHYIIPKTRQNFAGNSMVLIVPRKNTSNIRGFADLTADRCRIITIGTPESVPAGRYAVEVLQHAGNYTQIFKKVVFGEHVRQVLDYVARGEADAGIVYETDAISRSQETIIVEKAPFDSHTAVQYPIAVVAASRMHEQATDFVRFVCKNQRARDVLQKHGFITAVRVP